MKEDPGNYRTVRLTSVTEKMMEHLILEAVSLHMHDKKVIGVVIMANCSRPS